MHEIAIRGARVLLNDGLREVEVGLDGGEVTEVAEEVAPAMVEHEADGALLLPGLIDDHVHFREPGKEEKEDFATGTAAAAHGGVTTAIEIQNNAPLMISREAVEAKLALVRPKSRVNVGVYGSANRASQGRLAEFADLVFGFKIFLAPSHGDEGVDTDVMLSLLLEEVARIGSVAVIHAEDRAMIDAGIEAHARAGAAGWSKARSAAAEVKAVERAIRLCERTGCRIHLFHLSSAGAVDAVADAKARGLPVTAATCPHYVVFTEDDTARVGGLLKCNPSIKSAADRARLREGLRDGTLDVIETDHAPHLPEEKRAPFETNPSGLSGVDVFLPVLLHLVKEGVLTLDTLVERACRAPARLYGIERKGEIAAGRDADLVLVDDSRPWTPTESDFESKAKLSPWAGFEFPGRVLKTFVGGKVVWEERGD
ncbi:MAG: dihydroorotase family protein [Planctomycetota bacterium JB042]